MREEGTYILLKRLWRGYLNRHVTRLLGAIVCMGLAALSTALLAHFIQPLFDDICIIIINT